MISNLKFHLGVNITIAILTIIQFAIYIPLNFKNVEIYDNDMQVISNNKVEAFSTIRNELENIYSLKIINMKKENDKWNVRISVEGSKEEILRIVNKMVEFQIYNYNIDGKEGNLILTLDLYR
ncbi:hypothetical protein [Clostridium celatum]|uniref:Uncharacterized protein n=1 Tax=Clostridium celatum DSM 1785 TaxID=545697 RepID=L1QH26_9CLOT|nr:hypothetical protein [Clostridium celatum]EKY26985.1 hypothetical protein HMPREF0216_01588 [Clostridium celatum DSM 1785]MCE9654755.1 hypothetical protein [Clostridium celatum]MDU3722974.1 hypothetical protein [Clostridium celatum]MDU6295806.1 hypothetical protein [Clostridium celatum]MDY3359287.1 hypothetical protein [Clostridium celatum]